MKKNRKLTFKTAQKVEYGIVWRKPHKKYNASGLCDGPNSKKPKIYIDPKLLERRKLSVLVEEVCHAFFWDKPEKEVRKFAAVLTKMIYTMGWRKVK